jgi:hypothetical protein
VALATKRGNAALLPALEGGELLGLLGRVDAVVTSAGELAQVAAASGRPVVGVYGGGARFAESAPYGPGNLVVQGPPSRPAQSVPVEPVLIATLERLGMRPRAELASAAQRAQLTVWETSLLPEGADPLGGLTYRPVHQESLGVDDLLLFAMRGAFAAAFRGSGSVDLSFLSPTIPANRMSTTLSLTAYSSRITAMREALDRLATEAAKVPAILARGDMSTLGAVGKTLTEGLERLTRDAESFPLARSVVGQLDWTLRLAPVLAPIDTFAFAERAYRISSYVLGTAIDALRALLAPSPAP